MKKVLFVLLIISVLVFANSARAQGFLTSTDLFSRSVCDKPFKYRIGTVDSRFGLTNENVKSDLVVAENVWEKPSGKNLFEYDASATFTVNFVYDQKQALNSQINQLEGQLNSGKGDLETKQTAYQQKVNNFNAQVDALNADIAKSNAAGGASPEEFAKLKQRQSDLETQAAALKAEAKNLNLSAAQFNLNVGKLNNTISQFNADLAKKPEEGLYDPQADTISIYFVPSQKELEHTLAHELGHALGLGHVSGNASSIMYPYSSESVTASSEDLVALNTLCAPKSLPQAIFTNLSLLLQRKFGTTAN